MFTVVSAMMISVEGVVVVRAATERFLAELSVVVRFIQPAFEFCWRLDKVVCGFFRSQSPPTRGGGVSHNGGLDTWP